MLEHKAWDAAPVTKGPFGGNANRDLQFIPQDKTPGPGAYKSPESTLLKKNGPLRSDFGVDRHINEPKEGPGPGFYPDLPDGAGTSTSLPHAPRPPLFTVQQNPPPGQYNLDQSSKIQRSQLLRMGTLKEKSGKSQQHTTLLNQEASHKPGPANYFAKLPTIGGDQKFLKDLRNKEGTYAGQKMNDNPGPSDYGRVLPLDNTKTTSFGNSLRFDSNKTHWAPGPAQYQTEKYDMIKSSFNVEFDPKKQQSSKFKECFINRNPEDDVHQSDVF